MKGLVRLMSVVMVSSFLFAAFSAQVLGVSDLCNHGVSLDGKSFTHADQSQVWNPEFYWCISIDKTLSELMPPGGK